MNKRLVLKRTDRLMFVDSLKPNENICDEMNYIKQINKQNRRNIKFYILSQSNHTKPKC